MNYSLDRFTPVQKKVFTSFAKSDLSKQFYFTGGTALKVFYFNHRDSEDLRHNTALAVSDRVGSEDAIEAFVVYPEEEQPQLAA